MTTLAIDPATGDLAVTGNGLTLLDGADQVAQKLRSRLNTILGEWFLDPSVGVDYRGIVWVKGVPDSVVAAAFKREILTCPGVLQLLAYDQVLDNTRRLSITFTVQVVDGTTITISEVLP